MFNLFAASMDFTCTKQEVYEMLRTIINEKFSVQIHALEKEISRKKNIEFKISEDSITQFRSFLKYLKFKINKAHRKTDVFLEKNKKWLDSSFTFQVLFLNLKVKYSVHQKVSTTKFLEFNFPIRFL